MFVDCGRKPEEVEKNPQMCLYYPYCCIAIIMVISSKRQRSVVASQYFTESEWLQNRFLSVHCAFCFSKATDCIRLGVGHGAEPLSGLL